MSDVPFLRRARERTVLDIVDYRRQWNPRDSGLASYGWLLGDVVRGAEPHRQTIVASIDDLAVRTVAEEVVRPLGWDEMPPWAVRYVATASAAGRLELGAVSSLLHRIDDYRIRRGLQSDAHDAALGPPPTDPLGLAEYRLLECEIAASLAPRPLSRSIV